MERISRHTYVRAKISIKCRYNNVFNFRSQKDKYRLKSLIFQNSKYTIDAETGEQFARLLACLKKVDLKSNTLNDEAVKNILKTFSDKKGLSLEKLDLTDCSISRASHGQLQEVNRRNGNVIQISAFDDLSFTSEKSCKGFRICCN